MLRKIVHGFPFISWQCKMKVHIWDNTASIVSVMVGIGTIIPKLCWYCHDIERYTFGLGAHYRCALGIDGCPLGVPIWRWIYEWRSVVHRTCKEIVPACICEIKGNDWMFWQEEKNEGIDRPWSHEWFQLLSRSWDLWILWLMLLVFMLNRCTTGSTLYVVQVRDREITTTKTGNLILRLFYVTSNQNFRNLVNWNRASVGISNQLP